MNRGLEQSIGVVFTPSKWATWLINRNKIGSMALAGESLFVLEMRPASYAILAANEAEKAARIKVVDYRMIGGQAFFDRKEVKDAIAITWSATLRAGEEVLTLQEKA